MLTNKNFIHLVSGCEKWQAGIPKPNNGNITGYYRLFESFSEITGFSSHLMDTFDNSLLFPQNVLWKKFQYATQNQRINTAKRPENTTIKIPLDVQSHVSLYLRIG